MRVGCDNDQAIAFMPYRILKNILFNNLISV